MIVTLPCSGCAEEFRLIIVTDGTDLPVAESMIFAVVKMQAPSNGLRGKNHVPAHEVQSVAALDTGGDLLLWDCPRCGYADSTYADKSARDALS